MTVEVRRVQRLGNASLVVTIPKEWARRLGISQGSRVVLIDEGDNIRIFPAEGDGSARSGAMVDAAKLGRRLTVLAANCAYLSGYNSLTIVGAGPLAGEIRSRASQLLGVEVHEHDDSIEVRVLVDRSKIDVKASLRAMGFAASRLLGVLARVAGAGRVSARDAEEATVLRTDYARHQHLIIRYLAQKGTGSPAADAFHVALAASYLGMLSDAVWGGIGLLQTMGAGSGSREAAELAREAGELAVLAGRIVISPSARRIGEYLGRVSELRRRVEELLAEKPGAWETVALATIHSAARTLRILGYIAACKAVDDALKARG